MWKSIANTNMFLRTHESLKVVDYQGSWLSGELTVGIPYCLCLIKSGLQKENDKKANNLVMSDPKYLVICSWIASVFASAKR